MDRDGDRTEHGGPDVEADDHRVELGLALLSPDSNTNRSHWLQ